MIGTTISHYRVLEKLGSGGMGIVYAAEDLKLGRRVALKFLTLQQARDPKALHRFEREARSASALNHPNICTIYDIDECDGQRFIAMELLKGKTLRDWIEHERMSLERLLDFACQAVAGLEAAHGEGIIHRDIKPANIFVTVHGYVKLLDFGLAKLSALQRGAMETAAGATMAAEIVAREDLTMPGFAPGTIAYMSPEQALGEPLDPRTDLFSFGAVLYQMATRRLPFAGNTSIGTIDAILHKPPSPVVALNREIPLELQTIITKALEKDLHLRYQSATELRADLLRLQRNLQAPSAEIASDSASTTTLPPPISGEPKLTSEIAERPPRKRRSGLVAIVALVVGVVLLGLAIKWKSAGRAPAPVHLSITSLPGAQIFIDEKPDGQVGAEGTADLQLLPGEHSLRVSQEKFEPYSATLSIRPGEPQSVAANLKPIPAEPPPATPASGNLLVHSNVSAADILVDGQLKGFTAAGGAATLPLNEGTHSVEVKKTGYKDVPAQTVDLHAKQESQLVFKLEPSSGAAAANPASYLIVKSNPTAQIQVDGKPSGTVDANGAFPIKLDPGTHQVQASLEGYESYSADVAVKSGGKTYLVATLKPLPPVVTTFRASQDKIIVGHATTLNWTTQHAKSVVISPGIGTVSPTGTYEVSPTKTTTYLLSAEGNGGSTNAKITIAVELDPADLQAIDETMARFKGAYDSMNVDALRREWPSLTQTQADALKTTFLGLKSVSLTDDCSGSPTVVGDTARWSCNETIAYFLKDSHQIPKVRNNVVFHFKKGERGWFIDQRVHPSGPTTGRMVEPRRPSTSLFPSPNA